MISSSRPIQDTNSIHTESIEVLDTTQSTKNPGTETISQVFNETISANETSEPKIQIKDTLEIKETHGFEAFDLAVQARNIPLAKRIMRTSMEKEWATIKEACNKAEAMDQAVLVLDDLSDEVKDQKSICSRGYAGHNNLLLRAINYRDYKAFIRICMDSEDGSWRNSQDPETLYSLLHLSAVTEQEELIYFLLLQGADLELKDKDGLTVKQAAEKHNRKDLSELIDNFQLMLEFQREASDLVKEKIEAFQPEMKEKLSNIINSVEGYIEVFKGVQATYFSEDGKLTDEGKAKKDFAKHGLAYHQEGSHGHNAFIVESIAQGSLENLVTFVKLGASLDTLSLPSKKVIEDPHGYGLALMDYVTESMRTYLQESKEVFMGEDLTLWDRNLGVGKSLLDLAVIYSSEKQDNLDMIAYLMRKGLDPLRTNDEGESPFSLALVKGNLKAALLMMGYEKISEEKIPELSKEELEKAFLYLKEGAKMRDPLYVNSSKTRAGVFAAFYLLTRHYANNDAFTGMLSWLNTFAFFQQTFMSDELTYREKLNVKSENTLYFPGIVKSIYPTLYKASILEITALPQYPFGTLGMSAINVYSSVMSTFSSLKTACHYMTERPLASLYKVGMDVLPTIKNINYFKDYFTYLVYEPLSKHVADRNCDTINPRDYKDLTFSQKLDSKLEANCKEHAKAIFTDKWDQAAYENDPDGYLNQLLANTPSNVPLELLGDNRLVKLREAISTLQPRNYLKDTAIKGGVIWTAAQVGLDFWQPLARASIFYNIGTRILHRIIS